MTGVLVDVAIALIVVLFAGFGLRSGLLKSGSALVGLALGLVVAVPVSSAVGRTIDSAPWRLAAVVGLLVLLANLGYVGGMLVGERLRGRLRGRGARGLDRAAGGVLSMALAIVLVWMLALPLAASPVPGLAKAMRASALLPRIDAVMPDAARGLYDLIDDAIVAQGLPDVIGRLQETDVAEVGEPDPALSGDPEVVAASGSVVKVVGLASQCDRIIDGSGFFYAPGRVATNAHVVAGTSSTSIEVDGERYPATVVYADENLDLAVLKVVGADLPALPLDGATQPSGTDVVVVGHPGGGPLALASGKVRAQGEVTGPSFRDDETVTRDVLMLRGTVVPGNSGGPVVDLDGEVVGVVFGAAADEPDVGYALSIGAITDELQAASTASDKVVTGACYP